MSRTSVASAAIADRYRHTGCHPDDAAEGEQDIMLTTEKRPGAASSRERRRRVRAGIDAGFLPDGSEFPGIGEAPLARHGAQ